MGESTGQAILFAGTILDRHPLVVVGGVLYPNPFFVPPEQFLRELRDRVRD